MRERERERVERACEGSKGLATDREWEHVTKMLYIRREREGAFWEGADGDRRSGADSLHSHICYSRRVYCSMLFSPSPHHHSL